MTTSTIEQDLDKVVRILRAGGVVALPSDTLYALVAPARDDAAVRRAYAIKGREDGKPMPVFVSGLEMAQRIARVDHRARLLAARFWPGALTLVLPKAPDFRSEALAGGNSVALRVPDNDLLLRVLEKLDQPLTGTSANRSGGPDPVSAEEVRRQLDDEIDFLLDAGPCKVGVSSTIVDCTAGEPRILRQGAIAAEDVMQALQE